MKLTEEDRKRVVKAAEEMQALDGLNMPLWHYLKTAERAYVLSRAVHAASLRKENER